MRLQAGQTIKPFILAFTLIAILPSLAEGRSTAASNEQPFVFCYLDQEVYPYYAGDGTAVPERPPGLVIDLLRLAFEQVQVPIEIVRKPWNRCMRDLASGHINGVVASYLEERAYIARYPMKDKALDPRRRILTAVYAIYQRENQPWVWNGKEFVDRNTLLGVPLGYSVGSRLRAQGLKTFEAGTIRDQLEMLQRERITVVIALETAVDSILSHEREKFAGIVKTPLPLQAIDLYLLLSKDFIKEKPDLADRLWQAMADARITHYSQFAKRY